MKKMPFTTLLIVALLIGVITLLVFSNQKRSLLKFMQEADTIQYKCSVSRASIPNKTLLENNEQVRKFLGDFKLVSKEACKCAHMDMLIFHKGKESLMVSICDHCFDIIVTPAQNGQHSVVEHYKMPDKLYQRFKAFQVDWESQQQNADNNSTNF